MNNKPFCVEYRPNSFDGIPINANIGYTKEDVVSMLKEYGVPNVHKLTDKELISYFDEIYNSYE